MAVTLNVHPEADASGYVSLAFFQEFCGQRLLDIAEFSDDQLKAAIIKATDYMDARFKFHGHRLEKNQPLEWPRAYAYDNRGDPADDIPQAVQASCCEYSFRALRLELMPDPSISDTGGVVKSTTEKVGPISESITYETAHGITFRTFPIPDGKLRRSNLVWFNGGGAASVDIGRA